MPKIDKVESLFSCKLRKADIKAFFEAIKILDSLEEYIVWAGIASSILANIKSSPDIDVFVWKRGTFKLLKEKFSRLNWKIYNGKKRVRFKKESLTVDVVFFRAAQFIPFVCYKIDNLNVKVASPEALFLLKIMQLTYKKRPPEKLTKDILALERLRKIISLRELARLLKKLPRNFLKIESFY